MNDKKPLAHDTCIHIFTVSAAMVGVCVTVVGLMRVFTTMVKMNTLADDLMAIDALFFLAACLMSYWALRTRNTVRMYRIERIADLLFIMGLIPMTVATLFIVYAIAVS